MADAAILAIDQGTTSSRAIVFDRAGTPIAQAQREFAQHFPRDGWVEHDPEEIWQSVLAVCRAAVAEAREGGQEIAAAGIANQRETTIVWDRGTGQPIHRAIVWQDRRGAEMCRALREAGHEPMVREKTGLVLDSYFSATKIRWLLDNVEGARAGAERGELAFGTVDSFLLWRLTGGAVHATDATNASRTMLFDIHEQAWDDELLGLFGVPRSLLPDVRDCAGGFGRCAEEHFGSAIPITGIAGDQQAATVGQACFAPGMAKSTYGTGCFALVNAGDTPPDPAPGILATVAYRLDGQPAFAVEGSIFNAGATVQWLRDTLGIIRDSAETEAHARALDGNGGVYIVPAFTGLGAPNWDPDARGAIFGLTRDTGPAELARAALESVAYQTRDLVDAMGGLGVDGRLRVDGGMTANAWLMEFLADMLGVPVERPRVGETTALGAAYLAGLGAGLYGSLDEIGELWRLDRRFDPEMNESARERLQARWRTLVERVRETR